MGKGLKHQERLRELRAQPEQKQGRYHSIELRERKLWPSWSLFPDKRTRGHGLELPRDV